MDIRIGKRDYTLKKVTLEMLNAILKDIAQGGTKKHSAEANGISSSHFHYIVKQGRLDLTYGIDSLYANFVVSLRKIELAEIKNCKKSIRNNKKGHLGAQWTLEHYYKDEFGANAAVEELNARMDMWELEQSKEGETNGHSINEETK